MLACAAMSSRCAAAPRPSPSTPPNPARRRDHELLEVVGAGSRLPQMPPFQAGTWHDAARRRLMLDSRVGNRAPSLKVGETDRSAVRGARLDRRFWRRCQYYITLPPSRGASRSGVYRSPLYRPAIAASLAKRREYLPERPKQRIAAVVRITAQPFRRAT